MSRINPFHITKALHLLTNISSFLQPQFYSQEALVSLSIAGGEISREKLMQLLALNALLWWNLLDSSEPSLYISSVHPGGSGCIEAFSVGHCPLTSQSP